RAIYERHLAQSIEEIGDLVGPQDVVIVHDPQPAGLVPACKRLGATAIWRCHIGVDEPNELAREGWDFLRPYVGAADATVFSRSDYVWPGLETAEVIPPSIDVFA